MTVHTLLLPSPAAPVAPDIDHILNVIDEPDAAAQIEKRAKGRYSAAYPRMAVCAATIGHTEKLIAFIDRENERFEEEIGKLGPTRISYGERETPLTPYDRIKFIGFASFSVAGIFLGAHSLASYMSGSTAVRSLYGAYLMALGLSGVAVSGALALEAYKHLIDNEGDQRRYIRNLLVPGFGMVMAFAIAASITFAPKPPPSRAEIARAAANQSVTAAGVSVSTSGIAHTAIIATHLIAEMLLTAVLAAAANRLDKTGRKPITKLHPQAELCRQEIDKRKDQLRALEEANAADRAELQAHEEAQEASVAQAKATAEAIRRQDAISLAKGRAELAVNLKNGGGR